MINNSPKDLAFMGLVKSNILHFPSAQSLLEENSWQNIKRISSLAVLYLRV